jgi:hypothetical protein
MQCHLLNLLGLNQAVSIPMVACHLYSVFLISWSMKLQKRIVRETNRYTSKVPEDNGGAMRGGLEWTPL